MIVFFGNPRCLSFVSLSVVEPEVAADGEGFWFLLDLGLDLGLELELWRTLRLALDLLRTRRIRACCFAHCAVAFPLPVVAAAAHRAAIFPLAMRAAIAHCTAVF